MHLLRFGDAHSPINVQEKRLGFTFLLLFLLLLLLLLLSFLSQEKTRLLFLFLPLFLSPPKSTDLPPADSSLTHHAPPPPQPLRPPSIQRLRHKPHMLHPGLLLPAGQALLALRRHHRNVRLARAHALEVRVLRVHDELAGRAGLAGVAVRVLGRGG